MAVKATKKNHCDEQAAEISPQEMRSIPAEFQSKAIKSTPQGDRRNQRQYRGKLLGCLVFEHGSNRRLKVKLITDAFHGFDVLFAQPFAQFADVHVNGAVAHNHVAAPYFVKNFFAGEYAAGFGSQQPQDFKFFAGQFDGLFCP